MARRISDDPAARKIFNARAATGDGDLQERLIRLMVWVGASHRHLKDHNGIKDPIELIRRGEGWCDQQSKIFCFLSMHFYDIQARGLSVQSPGCEEGHSMCEVYYEDSWHLFDVHTDHQHVYRDAHDIILSYEALREAPDIVDYHSAYHWWRGDALLGLRGFFAEDSKFRYFPYSKESLPWRYPEVPE